MQAWEGRRKECVREVSEEEEWREAAWRPDLAHLVGVFLHPHPGHVGLDERHGQLEPLQTQNLPGEHADHCLAVGSLREAEQAGNMAITVLEKRNKKIFIVLFWPDQMKYIRVYYEWMLRNLCEWPRSEKGGKKGKKKQFMQNLRRIPPDLWLIVHINDQSPVWTNRWDLMLFMTDSNLEASNLE